MEEVRLNIQKNDDRRTMAGILADNGYNVRIEEETKRFDTSYFIIITLNKK